MKTLIINASNALGDSIAWVPYAEEYRQITGDDVYLHTPQRDLFEKVYPNIKFVNINLARPVLTKEANTIYRFSFGSDYDNHTVPMQWQVARQLKVPFREIRPRIFIEEKPKPALDQRYVCLGIQSTAQMKYWNREGGWQEVVDYLNSQNIAPLLIDRYASFGRDEYLEKNNAKKLRNVHALVDPEFTIPDRVQQLMGADAFLGLGSGLSWLAWAIYVPVVMVAGFSKPYYEFQDGNYRVHNPDVCNGCFNIVRMNPQVWDWCPLDIKKEPFECSKKITPEMVIAKLDQALKSPMAKPEIRQDFYFEEMKEWVKPDPSAPIPREIVLQGEAA